MFVAQLIKYTFDNMENRDAVGQEVIATFHEGSGLTPYGKACNYLLDLPPEKIYFGWDKKSYPYYRLVESQSL